MNYENNQQQSQGGKGKLDLIRGFLDHCRGLFFITLLSSAIMALADLVTPQIIRIAIDNCIDHNEPTSLPTFVIRLANHFGGFDYLGEHLGILAIAILLIAAVRAIVTYLYRLCNTWGTEVMVKNMRDYIFHHIEHLPFSWHMKNRTGDIIQRCTSDIETIRAFVSEKLMSLFRIIVLLILSMIFMFAMNVPLTIIALIPIPFIVLYSVYFHKKLSISFLKCDENEGILSDMAQENFTGVRVVRAFGREAYEKEKFEKHNAFYTDLWIQMSKIMSRFWSMSDLLSGVQIMLVVIFGAVFCIHDRMTPGEYVAFISYNSMLTWPIRELGRMIADMSRAGVSFDRIQYIMDSEAEEDRPNAVEPDMSGDIVFDHVNFAYDNCPQMLKDISFTIKGGTTLGILGGTGSGKSTLMLLLDRLYDLQPDSGKITVGGVDIADIRAEHLRKNVGIVLQEPYLFSRTVEENIGITEDNITLTEIREAARAACLDETIMNFSKGYDTFVGERGVTLSGGQKQRAAIARILTQHPPIMIFDDSLSAVDTETDEKIRNGLEKQFGTATIILVAHRITTLSKADHIIVMDGGRIVEEGTHRELKSAGGIYQKIYDIQNGGPIE